MRRNVEEVEALFPVIPGRCDASNPESRDSESGASAPSRNDVAAIRPEGKYERGRIKSEGPALLRAAQRPWAQARPVQRHHRAASDRLDLLARCQGQRQSRTLQLFQRL